MLQEHFSYLDNYDNNDNNIDSNNNIINNWVPLYCVGGLFLFFGNYELNENEEI